MNNDISDIEKKCIEAFYKEIKEFIYDLKKLKYFPEDKRQLVILNFLNLVNERIDNNLEIRYVSRKVLKKAVENLSISLLNDIYEKGTLLWYINKDVTIKLGYNDKVLYTTEDTFNYLFTKYLETSKNLVITKEADDQFKLIKYCFEQRALYQESVKSFINEERMIKDIDNLIYKQLIEGILTKEIEQEKDNKKQKESRK